MKSSPASQSGSTTLSLETSSEQRKLKFDELSRDEPKYLANHESGRHLARAMAVYLALHELWSSTLQHVSYEKIAAIVDLFPDVERGTYGGDAYRIPGDYGKGGLIRLGAEEVRAPRAALAK